MDQIKPYLSYVGGALAFYGIVSIILWFTPYEVRAISWINNFGVAVSWVLRIVFVAGGAALFFLFRNSSAE